MSHRSIIGITHKLACRAFNAVRGQGASEYTMAVIIIAAAVLVLFVFRDQLLGFIDAVLQSFADVDHGF